VGGSDPERGFSWYDVLGVLAGASAETIQRTYEDKMSLLAPHPRPRGRVPVPDVRGLFYAVGLEVAGRLGLQVRAVRLTEHPMPVDGLVVDQSPLPPTTVRRGAPLTVKVWHPPVRSSGHSR
jgi:PASTA domain